MKFLFFDVFPDPTNMYVTINECTDPSCSSYSSLLDSTAVSVVSGYEVKASKTGVVKITFGFIWSGHSQARFVLAYTSGNNGNSSYPTCNGLAPNFWNHIALVVKQVNSTSISALIYINGTVVAESFGPVGPFIGFSRADGLAIGRVEPKSKPYGYLNGSLDELVFWNRSLSQEEVAASMYRVCKDQDEPLLCHSFDHAALSAPGKFEDHSGIQSSDAVMVVDDRYMPWCSTRGDEGMLLISATKVCTSYEKSWGLCTDRVHLPGMGFEYDSHELLATAENMRNGSSIRAVASMPGCLSISLTLSGNVAGRLCFHCLRPI